MKKYDPTVTTYTRHSESSVDGADSVGGVGQVDGIGQHREEREVDAAVRGEGGRLGGGRGQDGFAAASLGTFEPKHEIELVVAGEEGRSVLAGESDGELDAIGTDVIHHGDVEAGRALGRAVVREGARVSSGAEVNAAVPGPVPAVEVANGSGAVEDEVTQLYQVLDGGAVDVVLITRDIGGRHAEDEVAHLHVLVAVVVGRQHCAQHTQD